MSEPRVTMFSLALNQLCLKLLRTNNINKKLPKYFSQQLVSAAGNNKQEDIADWLLPQILPVKVSSISTKHNKIAEKFMRRRAQF